MAHMDWQCLVDQDGGGRRFKAQSAPSQGRQTERERTGAKRGDGQGRLLLLRRKGLERCVAEALGVKTLGCPPPFSVTQTKGKWICSSSMEEGAVAVSTF